MRTVGVRDQKERTSQVYAASRAWLTRHLSEGGLVIAPRSSSPK